MSLAVGPILLERRCDGGWGDLSPGQKAQLVTDRLNGEVGLFAGCQTRFRWWWGVSPICPKCGRAYISTFDMLGRYQINMSDFMLRAIKALSDSGGVLDVSAKQQKDQND